MKKENTPLSASCYHENTIEIPYSRLRNFIQPGDIIRGKCDAVRASASYIEYIVTFVDWWGVMAVPTPQMFEKSSYNEKRLAEIKKHHKFKWVNIQGVIFKPEKENNLLKTQKSTD